MVARNRKMVQDARNAPGVSNTHSSLFEGPEYNRKFGFWENLVSVYLHSDAWGRFGIHVTFLLGLAIIAGFSTFLTWLLPSEPTTVNKFTPGSYPCIQCTIQSGPEIPGDGDDNPASKNLSTPRQDSNGPKGPPQQKERDIRIPPCAARSL